MGRIESVDALLHIMSRSRIYEDRGKKAKKCQKSAKKKDGRDHAISGGQPSVIQLGVNIAC